MTIQFNPRTNRRGIEWCDETRNVFGGCFHRCRWTMADGTIARCYAEELAENGVAKAGYPNGFEHHYYRPHNLSALKAGSVPKMIFCDSMSDMFGHWVDEAHVIEALMAMGEAPQHTYQSLTKAPARILKFTEHLPWNLWVGVSSPPDYLMPANGRVPEFDGTGIKPANPLPLHAKKRMLEKSLQVLENVRRETGNVVWMSIEPASWDMAPVYRAAYEHSGFVLDWVVIGAAANGGRYYQPDPEIIRDLLLFFEDVGTAVFFKGNIKPTFKANDFGSDALNRWREDFPVTHPGTGRPFPAVLRRQEEATKHGWTLNTLKIDGQMPSPKPVGQMSLFSTNNNYDWE